MTNMVLLSYLSGVGCRGALDPGNRSPDYGMCLWMVFSAIWEAKIAETGEPPQFRMRFQ